MQVCEAASRAEVPVVQALASGLQQLLDYSGEDMEETFVQSFRISYQDVFGSVLSHDLRENGDSLLVNQDNKWVSAALRHPAAPAVLLAFGSRQTVGAVGRFEGKLTFWSSAYQVSHAMVEVEQLPRVFEMTERENGRERGEDAEDALKSLRQLPKAFEAARKKEIP